MMTISTKNLIKKEEEKVKESNTNTSNIVSVEEPPDERYYDLSIVYDDYYYTPRLFISGVNE